MQSAAVEIYGIMRRTNRRGKNSVVRRTLHRDALPGEAEPLLPTPSRRVA